MSVAALPPPPARSPLIEAETALEPNAHGGVRARARTRAPPTGATDEGVVDVHDAGKPEGVQDETKLEVVQEVKPVPVTDQVDVEMEETPSLPAPVASAPSLAAVVLEVVVQDVLMDSEPAVPAPEPLTAERPAFPAPAPILLPSSPVPTCLPSHLSRHKPLPVCRAQSLSGSRAGAPKDPSLAPKVKKLSLKDWQKKLREAKERALATPSPLVSVPELPTVPGELAGRWSQKEAPPHAEDVPMQVTQEQGVPLDAIDDGEVKMAMKGQELATGWTIL
ncbi:hypothetical protein ONZ51_g2053 [Trametes cubensis]|uniref:Uncharacterized protein n=1 Tax=Trametes cubensis TaxID=1111947 RepID=A0AAD7U2Z4_9APHY|nr:hypothetical protein ONZ51_g2053 [Trametes cubensis]